MPLRAASCKHAAFPAFEAWFCREFNIEPLPEVAR